MLLPVVLSIFTAAIFVVSVTQDDFAAHMLPAFVAFYAALVLLVRALLRLRPREFGKGDRRSKRESSTEPSYRVSRHARAEPRAKKKRAPKSHNPVIVDGSNVMHWKDGVARAETLVAVVHKLKSMGYSPGVVFDANVGFKLAGEYRDDAELAETIGLHEDQVLVVKSGTSADPMILQMSRELKAPIVSNDRFRDWAEDWPEVAEPSNFIRGDWQGEKLLLNRFSPQKAARRKKAAPAQGVTTPQVA